MQNTKPTISLKEVEELRRKLNDIYFPNEDKKVVYNSKEVEEFLKIINSERVGIPKGTSPKEIGIILERWYENLTQAPEYSAETVTEAPRPTGPDTTTLTSDQLENLEKQRDEREAQIKQTQENAKVEVGRARKRTEEIIKEQQKIQAQIAKTKAVETEIKNIKDLHIKIEEIEKVQFTPEEKVAFDEYKKEAIEHPEETKVRLAREIHSRLDKVLTEQGIKQEEIDILINETSKRTVENFVESAKPQYTPPTARIAINNAVLEKIPTAIPQEVKNVIKNSVNTNSVYRFQPDLFYKEIVKTAFGDNVANAVFGSEFKVIVSETPIEGETHSFNFYQASESSNQILGEQNQTIESLKSFGQQEARTYLMDQTAMQFAKSSLGQKVLANPKVEATFYSVFAGAGKTVTWEGVGIGKYVVGTGYENAVYLATGNRFLTPTITVAGGAVGMRLAAQAAAQATTEITLTGGIMAGEAFAGGVGPALASQTVAKAGLGGLIAKVATTLGVASGTVSFGVGAIVGTIVGEIAKRIDWAKIKRWFEDNKAVFVGLGAGAGLFFGGPVVGGVALLGGLALTGTLGAFAAGVFGVLGFIGRQVGIAIATPVIITLLVIPPLVAFILLVINNSAYVVPPSSLTSAIGADNPYMLVTKTALPTKIGNPQGGSTVQVTYTVSIKALKENLKNIKIVSSECNVVTKDRSIACPLEEIPALEPSLSVSPTSPYNFTFYGEYDSNYIDSLIFDSVTVSAETEKGEEVTTSGSATVCIGDCPTDCVKVEDFAQKWPTNLKSNSETALGILSGQYQGFMSKVCSKNETLALCYAPNQIDEGYYAWHIHNAYGDKCDVYFNQKGLQSETDALFLITHELSHHVQNIYGGWRAEYENSGAWNEISSRGFCTYSDTKGSETESMAEANALFTNSRPSWDACASNYKSLYPRNYMFAEKFMK